LNFELTVALSSINAPKYPEPKGEKYVISWGERDKEEVCHKNRQNAS
jgi:hypothetical protein